MRPIRLGSKYTTGKLTLTSQPAKCWLRTAPRWIWEPRLRLADRAALDSTMAPMVGKTSNRVSVWPGRLLHSEARRCYAAHLAFPRTWKELEQICALHKIRLSVRLKHS